MTYTEMYQWIEEPSMLTKASLPDLKQLVDEYPCFHAVRMLYLKNLAVLEDVRLEKELKKMAICIPDRKRLFMLLEDKRFKRIQPNEASAADVDRQNRTEEVISAIEKALSGSEPAALAGDSADIQRASDVFPVAASDYIHYLEAYTEDLPTDDGADNRLKRQDLIDSFITNDKQRIQRLTLTPDTEKAPEQGTDDEPAEAKHAFENTSLDDSYFTETLARVYFAQKRYDKTLEIFRVLSLKYPKKNAYFADQIRYLEKIINIKK